MDRVSAGLGLAWGGRGVNCFFFSSSYDIIVLGENCGGGWICSGYLFTTAGAGSGASGTDLAGMGGLRAGCWPS